MEQRCRFGLFDFDPESGELRREGVPVRLQAQPAQVLRMLIEANGELVTREAIRGTVWGNDTHVDFDRGLNVCISQIRNALGDSADSPRFVRTIPKRGYQFIAPMTSLAAPADTPSATTAPPPHGHRRWMLAAILVMAAAGAGLALVWPRFSKSALGARIAVTRFDNETGISDLDRFAGNLTDLVTTELTSATAGRYGVIGNASILRVPRRERNLKEIAAALDVRWVVLGQVQKGESGIRVLAHLIRMPGQTHVAVLRVEAPREDFPGNQSKLADQILKRFIGPLTAGERP